VYVITTGCQLFLIIELTHFEIKRIFLCIYFNFVYIAGTPPVEIVWVHNNSEVNEDHPNYRTTCSDNVHQLGISKSKVVLIKKSKQR
jgi:hypothetical protein